MLGFRGSLNWSGDAETMDTERNINGMATLNDKAIAM
jgi:hypothetical protein